MKRWGIDPAFAGAYVVSDEDREAMLAPVLEIERKRAELLDEATASCLYAGWSASDIHHEIDTLTKRQTLSVRGVAVFEVNEVWSDTKVTLAWQWLALIPARDGYTTPSA